MSALPSIGDRLRRAGRAMKLAAVSRGAAWWLGAALGVWLPLCIADNLLRLPAGLRLPLTVLAVAGLAAAFVRHVGRPAVRRWSAERAACELESRYAVRHNALINACCLERQALSAQEQWFAGQTARVSEAELQAIAPRELWRLPALTRGAVVAAAMLAAWLAYTAVFPRYSANALLRYALPLADVPAAGAWAVETTPARAVTLCEGDDLTVRVTVRRCGGEGAGREGDVHPSLLWREGARPVGVDVTEAESVLPLGAAETGGVSAYTFRAVARSFSFRAVAGDAASRCVAVTVVPMPRIRTSLAVVRPPAYTGLSPVERPGPPAALTVLPGTRLDLRLSVAPEPRAVRWVGEGTRLDFVRDGEAWTAGVAVDAPLTYRLAAVASLNAKEAELGSGRVALAIDRAPDVDLVVADRNLLLPPGAAVDLRVQAADDYGLSAVRILATPGDGVGDGVGAAPAARGVKAWTYVGPPGPRGPVAERYRLVLDPAVFPPGSVHLLEAAASDFRPGAGEARSRPVVLRIRALDDLGAAPTPEAGHAFALLRQAIAEQRKANELTTNLATHRDEALSGGRLGLHRQNMDRQQVRAREVGRRAQVELAAAREWAVEAARLKTLVEDEMGLALAAIGGMTHAAAAGVADLTRLADRQAYILNEMTALLGRVSAAGGAAASGSAAAGENGTPSVTVDEAASELRDDMKDFERIQKRLIEASKALADRSPEDLTDEEERILGELAREEAKWARFFEEKLTDFGKLPLQDFADGSLAQEINEVLQEVANAAESLYKKNVELAVPQEQSGLEKASELVHNLERWLAGAPDSIKWNMEEPPSQADIPLAELPAELEDIVGELMDSEEAMAEEVEDVSSSWMDSLDKGAGWGVSDGPISDMSAKGITGDLLPNTQEVGGRSGEGRTGKSHGQMVEETAEGKGGRETPTRQTPSPYESGSVQDSSTEETGGATGGGKLSGFAGAGLRGQPPPPMMDIMKRLADQQAGIRQQAEALALKLRDYKLPTGDLEVSIHAMKRFESAGQRGEPQVIRAEYSRILDALAESRDAVRAETGLLRENARIPRSTALDLMAGLRETTPRGYEEMVAEYFRRLAEERGP